MLDVAIVGGGLCGLAVADALRPHFPGEHRPSADYVAATLRDVAAAWQELSREANAVRLGKHSPPPVLQKPVCAGVHLA